MQSSTTPEAVYNAPSGTDEALVRDLGLLMRHLLERSNRTVFQAFDELDLTFTQTKILMSFTGREEPRPIKSIVDEHGFSFPAASRAIDGLLKRGLVTRTEDPHDRRCKQIALSDEGLRITRRIFELRVAGIQDFVATLDPDERRELGTVLEPIIARGEVGMHPPAPATGRTADA